MLPDKALLSIGVLLTHMSPNKLTTGLVEPRNQHNVLPGNSQLGAMVIQYGQELALLAKRDFRRAVLAVEQFQYLEASRSARLSIVEAALH